ncbi:MAG: DinB family protein [Bacteroidetes bacterium]|nr:MAG: DinB family protein [Bacteroidota bacterium]TAG90577.1 MAG: DinB family protein [Bacteroidota bacterium]
MFKPDVIFAQIEKSLDSYVKNLDNYSDNQFYFKSSPEIWSLGQMYAHLVSSHSFFIYHINNCLQKRKGQEGGEKNEFGTKILIKNSFPPIKISIPDAWKGEEPIAKTIQEYKDIFPTMKNNMKNILENIKNDDQSYKTLHVAAGWLSAVEWLQVADMHLRHHFRQRDELETTSKNLLST